MWTGDLTYNDLVTSALGNVKNLQEFIDDVFAEKYNGLQLDGFRFAPDMQVDFTYEQIEKTLGLNVMATYVDIDSPGTPISMDGFALTTGKIPRMKKRAEYDENEMRKIMVLQERFGNTNLRAINAAKRTLFDVTDKLIGAHTNSMSYQRHQMISKGKLELTAANNPAGLSSITFSASVPTGNVTTLTGNYKWWTDATHATEGSSADPIKDLRAKRRAMELKNIISMHMEIDALTFEDLLGHSAVKKAIGYHIQPLAGSDAIATAIAVNAGYDAEKAVLEKLIGCRIVAVDSIVAVEKWDKATMALTQSQIRAFAPDVCVFVPDGLLGEVKTVEPVKLPLTNGTYADYYGGRLLMTVDFNILKKIQYIETEMTSLVVPDKPKYMMYLNVL